MSAPTLPPPPAPTPPARAARAGRRAPGSSLRAVLRLARRDARRGLGRSSLVALMILVPVLVVTAGAVLVRSVQLDAADEATVRLGSGAVQARVFGPFGDSPVLQDAAAMSTVTSGDDRPALPVAEAARRVQAVVGPRDRLVPVYGEATVGVRFGDRARRMTVTETDVAALGPGAPIVLLDGRLPAADDEVLATRRSWRGPDLAPGTRFTVLGDAQARAYRVVGTVRSSDPERLGDVVARPGAVLDEALLAARQFGISRIAWYVVGPDPVSWAQVRQVNAFGGFVVSRAAIAENPPLDPQLAGSRGPADVADTVTVFVAVALLLLQVMLMAGPAIAVGARRNERLLAVVAASGGSPAHLAGVVVGGAVVVGLVASVAGAALGVGGGALLVRLVGALTGEVLPRVDVRAADLVALVVAGTVTAGVAAALPARRVARLDVVAALTGRRRAVASGARAPLAGLVLLGAGTAAAWWASGRGEQIAFVLGIAAGEIGLVLLTSAVVTVFARLAGRAPTSLRFALRDAARHRGRTVPALAATVAALAAAVAVLVLGASNADLAQRGHRQAAASGVAVVPLTVGATDIRTVDVKAVEAAVRSALPGAEVGVGYGPPQTATAVDVTALLPDDCGPRRGCSTAVLAAQFVDPATAATVAPDGEQARGAVAAGKAVVWDAALVRDGTVTLTIAPRADATRARTLRVPAFVADGPERISGLLVPREVARAAGVDTVPQTVYVRGGSDDLRDDLRDGRLDGALLGVDPDLSPEIQTSRPVTAVDIAYVVLAVLGIVAALVGTFIAVGLAAADARPDLGTLAAVGADPSVRRRVAAAQAAAIALPGTSVGVVAGLLAGWLLVRYNDVAGYSEEHLRLVVPVVEVALLLLGVPLIVSAVGWLTVRSRLEVTRRLGE